MKLIQLANRIAKVDTTILMLGETGAGKDQIAKCFPDQSTATAICQQADLIRQAEPILREKNPCRRNSRTCGQIEISKRR